MCFYKGSKDCGRSIQCHLDENEIYYLEICMLISSFEVFGDVFVMCFLLCLYSLGEPETRTFQFTLHNKKLKKSQECQNENK